MMQFYNFTEDEIEQAFRDHILRKWDRERAEKFAFHLLGEAAEQAWKSKHIKRDMSCYDKYYDEALEIWRNE